MPGTDTSRGIQHGPLFLAFLGGIFLLLSVGLVYFGFTRWVGVDLRRWWVNRQRLRGDLLWGVASLVLVLAITLGGTLALTVLFPGLAPVGEAGADPSPTVAADAASGSRSANRVASSVPTVQIRKTSDWYP